jgi:hypothetical protein
MEAQAIELHVGVLEAALVGEVDDVVSEGVAGEGVTMQDAEVEGSADSSDVIEGEPRYEVEVAQVDEVDVVAFSA